MWTFRAMDTDVSIAAPGLAADAEETLAIEIAEIFADAERRFTRFSDDSELSRLNRATGSVTASRELIETLVAARRHVLATGGLFDPTVGAALVAAGYDRTFAALAPGPAAAAPPRAGFDELVIDEAARIVSRPAHLLLDLGGIVKGRTADRAAALLPAAGMIDAGGDAVVRGDGPGGDGWEIDVEDPADPARTVLALRLHDRAIATSAPNRRRWRSASGTAHHLIDPRTMRPSISDLAQATAIAATCEEAEVLAKVAFLLGAAGGARLLESRGAAGVLVDAAGAVHVVGDLEVIDG